MAIQRNYSAGRIALELEGKIAGALVEAQGGEPFGRVVAEPRGAGQRPGKHVAGVAYEPIVMRFGTGMSGDLYAWVGEAVDGRSTPMSGALLLADFDGAIRTRLEFVHAVVTEVAFDPLDAGGKSVPWRITVTIQPESTRRVAGSGTISSAVRAPKVVKASDFRVKISGLPTSSVMEVEFPTVTYDVKYSGVGPRDPGPHVSDVALGNLMLKVGARDEKAYFDAAEKFLIEGHSTNADELVGTVELLAPNMHDTVFTVTFKQLGFVRVAPQRQEAARVNVTRSVRAEFYCEAMGFAAAKVRQDEAVPSGGAGTPSTPSDVGAATVDAIAQLSTAVLGLAASERRDPALLQAAVGLLANGQVVRPDAALVALRLRGHKSVEESTPGALQRADGEEIGRSWAQQQASLEELTDIGALESTDWDAIGLPAGHSLLNRLVAEGAVLGDSDHPADLDRSSFVEGLVSGATEVLREVRPHL